MNAFTQKPQLDQAWLKKQARVAYSREGGRKRAEKMGGQIVPGMGTRDLEKVKVSR